jgi:hypothetical protein
MTLSVMVEIVCFDTSAPYTPRPGARWLRCVAGSADTLSPARQLSDRLGEFGERRSDPQSRASVDSELVVAAAQVLYEGVPGDHHLPCPISL